MPWKPSDALRHNKGANTPEKRMLWSATANRILRTTGDEARAIREANAVVGRAFKSKK